MPIIVNKNAEDNGHDVSNPILPDKEVKEQTSLGTNLVESKENDACTDGATVVALKTVKFAGFEITETGVRPPAQGIS